MNISTSNLGPYTHGGFEPITDELVGVALEYTGNIPGGLEGLFLRNGANTLFPRPNYHMFDGSAMVHAIEIRGGQARYSNTIIRTPFTQHLLDLGENPYVGFGEMTSAFPDTVQRMADQRQKIADGTLREFQPIERVFSSTAILHHDDHLYCLQETGLPFELDLSRDSEGWTRIKGTGRLTDFDGVLTTPFSAHPKVDVETQEVHSIGQDYLSGRTVHSVLHPGGTAQSTVIFERRPAALYSHDLVLTGSHVIFADSSLVYAPEGLAQSGSIARFDKHRVMRFGVIKRGHGSDDSVQWFQTAAPGHIWHIVNGWEENGCIHIIAPVFREYPSSIPIHTPVEPHADLLHYVLDLSEGRVVEETVLMHYFYERPSMDMRLSGRKARYAWLLDEQKAGIMGKGVQKFDMLLRCKAEYFDYGDMFGGEPVFVPRDPHVIGAEGDDGWICDLLANEERAELLVLDARTMEECCRIKMPRRVPFGVHGLWLDRGEVAKLAVARE